MTEKLFVRVNKDRIYGFTQALANRKDAVVMTESDVAAWRKAREQVAAGKPPRKRPTRTKLVKKPKGGKKKKSVVSKKAAPADPEPKAAAVTEPKAGPSDELKELLGDGANLLTGD